MELLIVKGWANKDVAKYLDLTEQAVASYKFQTISRLKEMARRAGLSLEEMGGGCIDDQGRRRRQEAGTGPDAAAGRTGPPRRGHGQNHGHDHVDRDRAPAPIDDAMLLDYLTDALCPEDSARVEKALRDSAELRAGSRTSARTAPTTSSTPWVPSGTAPG